MPVRRCRAIGEPERDPSRDLIELMIRSGRDRFGVITRADRWTEFGHGRLQLKVTGSIPPEMLWPNASCVVTRNEFVAVASGTMML